jgi:hypothetical protein
MEKKTVTKRSQAQSPKSPSIIAQLAEVAKPLLRLPVVLRTRRNHALEHATIHVLSRRVRNLAMSGRSDPNGFVLVGDVPTESVEQAVSDALIRMKKGESQLAVHPNCGTNLVTAGALTTLAAYIGTRGMKRGMNADRAAGTMTLMMLALMVAPPLGMSLQKHFTTEGEPGDLEVVSVERSERTVPFFETTMTLHTVRTRGGER